MDESKVFVSPKSPNWGFLKQGIPKTIGFNTKSWSNELDDFGVPQFRKPFKYHLDGL
jgi:hypothetical protein